MSPSASRTPAAIAVPLLLLLALCAALVADAWRDGGWLDGPLVVTPAVAGLWLGGRAHAGVTAVAIAAAALALTVANQRVHPGDYSTANDLAFFLVLLGGPALLGTLLGQRNRRASELRDLTERRRALLASEVRAARLEEQSRVASRVQHGVIQAMGAIVLQAVGAAHTRDPEAMRRALDDIESSARAALDGLREHVGVLRETAAAEPPPAPAPDPPSSPALVPRDAAFALALSVPLALECVVGGQARGPAVLNVLAVLALAGPLALARSRPRVAMATYAVLAGAISHWLTPLPATVSSFASVLLLGYRMGERPRRRLDQLLGLVLLLASMVAIWAAAAGGPGVGGTLPAVVVAALAWVGGVAAADRAARVRRLDRLLADLSRQREVAVRLATAEQRVALARDLHDSVAAAMTVVCLHAAGGRRQASGDVAALAETLRIIDHTARSGLSELRCSLDVLEGADMEALSLERVLADARHAGLDVVWDDRTRAGAPPAISRSLARVLREALVNVARHAPGAPVVVRLQELDRALVLEVVDQGARAPVADTTGTGHGLAGLRERLVLDGGSLSYGPHGRGFQVRASVPLDAAVPA